MHRRFRFACEENKRALGFDFGLGDLLVLGRSFEMDLEEGNGREKRTSPERERERERERVKNNMLAGGKWRRHRLVLSCLVSSLFFLYCVVLCCVVLCCVVLCCVVLYEVVLC